MKQTANDPIDRVLPQLPPIDKRLRVIIDTDFANEVDDMYAAALALASPERFQLEGFIATHFNNSGLGPESIDRSYGLLNQFLDVSGIKRDFPVVRSAPPIAYYGYPSEGEGVDLIIHRAQQGSKEDPLWVVGLGAATNLASAILKDPEILPLVRYVFHARSDHSWPERSLQFNVAGDIHAARTLLKMQVPLVWFDTGSQLKCNPETDRKYISEAGRMGRFMHEYRMNHPWKECRTPEKGFYDLGDIAWMMEPEICKSEIISAPSMDASMFFDHSQTNGRIIRVYDIDNNRTWRLLFEQLRRYSL